MATARELRELHDGLIGTLGEQAGGTMIDVLEQMATRDDLALLATRRDLQDLETRIDARFDREGRSVASEISAVRVEMTTQFGSVREDMAAQREDMATQFASVRHDLADVMVSRQTVVLTVIATIATLAAVIVGVVAVV